MSHLKITSKILEVMKSITSEQELSKLNESLIAQKLIAKTEYEITESTERITPQGVAWRLITVSCQLTIIDVESDEILVNIALGFGMDKSDKAVARAQSMAWRMAWLGALNIPEGGLMDDKPDLPSTEPEIIVETPESKLITHITALWRWDPALFSDYFIKRFQRPIDQLNITELSVVKSEFENHGR